MYTNTTQYLRALASDLVHGCRRTAADGTVIYTPDGTASYDGLWLRDFSYMVEYAGFAIPDQDIVNCIRYAVRHRRADGWMPDRVTTDGLAVYAAGIAAAPVGEANLDNTPFLIFTVDSLSRRMDLEDFLPLFTEWEADLEQGLFLLPLEEHGLVYNDVQAPHSPYGFTDTIGKTGTLYMESLLYWRACRMMEHMCKTYGVGNPDHFAEAAESVERSLSLLFDPAAGAFYAATKDCHQYDIWGMAYMLYIGFPCSADEKQAVLSFLEKNYDACVYRGQVRHLLKGQYWERLLIDVEPETYQNGAYWATASGWMIWCLAQQNPALAVRALEDVVSCFKTDGSFECINEGYEKLPLFVVSATNVCGGFERTISDFPEFGTGKID